MLTRRLFSAPFTEALLRHLSLHALAALAVVAVALSGCKAAEGDVCEIEDDCGEGLECCGSDLPDTRGICTFEGMCTVVPIDAGPRPDAGPQDAGPLPDAGLDAGTDAGPLPDAGDLDSGVDAGFDAGGDAGDAG
jgi:hypothetical protein